MARYQKARRGGGIGRALGLANAKLGMSITGAGAGDKGPPPGSEDFGDRARKRRARLQRRHEDVYIQQDESLQDKVLKA